MPTIKRKSLSQRKNAAKAAAKHGAGHRGLVPGKTKRFRTEALGSALKNQFSSKAHVTIVRLTLDEAAISRTDLANRAQHLSATHRAALDGARARAEARLRRPDMSAEALRARERAGAEWEARHGSVTAFAGPRRETRR